MRSVVREREGMGTHHHCQSAMYRALLPCLFLVVATSGAIFTNKTGCGETKHCMFRPAGCDPNLDCTLGIIFYVIGPNKMRVEMVAQSLIPPVQQQYIAMAFSHDPIMGNDSVTECVMSDMGQFAGAEPEVFVSFNHAKTNDRTFLESAEQKTLISNLASEVVDGKLVCHFTQQLVPQIDDKDGKIWSLDKDYYIMGATGSAQPDELNAHDLNSGSHFYPVVSSRKINPSEIGERKYDLPPKFIPKVRPTTTTKATTTTTTATIKMPTRSSSQLFSGIFIFILALLL